MKQNKNIKKKILTFNGVYLPGYKAGGPIKSIANMARELEKGFDFLVVASDRDYGDTEPYPNVKVNDWNRLDYENVYYHSGENINIFRFYKIIKKVEYDVVYLNGYYSNYTRKYLLLSKLGFIKKVPIVLSPRGDFSEGDSNKILKKFKKRVYILLQKLLSMDKGVLWHATSAIEKKDILNIIGENVEIIEASNIPSKINTRMNPLYKKSGEIKLVYISRINRKKNLLTAIKALRNLEGNVEFDIYGPIFDREYWEECKREISTLSSNIKVNYCGSIDSNEVPSTFSKHHFFLFPTFGENYGHVIIESLCSGCPVIISDRTPWINLEKNEVGWDIELDNIKSLENILKRCVLMENGQYINMVNKAYHFGMDNSSNIHAWIDTRDMFYVALKKNKCE